MTQKMLSPQDLDAAIETFSLDGKLAHGFVHGDEETKVPLGDSAIGGPNPPVDTPSIRKLVHDFGKTADGQLARSEAAATRAENARDSAEEAATIAVESLNDLKTLSIAVDDAPYGHVASGDYNPDTGMLTLRVPAGPQGESGRDGRNGTDGVDGRDGKDGEQGTPGVIMEIERGMFALEIVDGDLILFHDDQETPPDVFLDADGYLVWEYV